MSDDYNPEDLTPEQKEARLTAFRDYLLSRRSATAAEEPTDPGPTDGKSYVTTTTNVREKTLRTANSLVNGDRNNQYGDPLQDFARTATMWSAYLGVEIQPHDVASLMSLLKISRLRHQANKADTWVDLAGYAACGAHCADATEGLTW